MSLQKTRQLNCLELFELFACKPLVDDIFLIRGNRRLNMAYDNSFQKYMNGPGKDIPRPLYQYTPTTTNQIVFTYGVLADRISYLKGSYESFFTTSGLSKYFTTADVVAMSCLNSAMDALIYGHSPDIGVGTVGPDNSRPMESAGSDIYSNGVDLSHVYDSTNSYRTVDINNQSSDQSTIKNVYDTYNYLVYFTDTLNMTDAQKSETILDYLRSSYKENSGYFVSDEKNTANTLKHPYFGSSNIIESDDSLENIFSIKTVAENKILVTVYEPFISFINNGKNELAYFIKELLIEMSKSLSITDIARTKIFYKYLQTL